MDILKIKFVDNFTPAIEKQLASFVDGRVILQATRYGEQIRWLEMNGRYDHRRLIRQAWIRYLNQFDGTDFYDLASEAYHKAYNK